MGREKNYPMNKRKILKLQRKYKNVIDIISYDNLLNI